MCYIKPPVATIAIGNAFGEAAMLLAAGEPGRRAALPSASIMIRQPIQRFQQMQATDIDIYRTELRKTNAEVVGAWCGPRLGGGEPRGEKGDAVRGGGLSTAGQCWSVPLGMQAGPVGACGSCNVWSSTAVKTAGPVPHGIPWPTAQVRLLAKHTGHSEEQTASNIKRPRYMTPYEAVEYNLIDQVCGLGWRV